MAGTEGAAKEQDILQETSIPVSVDPQPSSAPVPAVSQDVPEVDDELDSALGLDP